jgi:hypothetical protein
MHECSGLKGLTAPLVESDGKRSIKSLARHTIQMREDYVGRHDPIMGVRTDHADGSNDGTTFPITAVGDVRSMLAGGGIGACASPSRGGAGVQHHKFHDSSLLEGARIARRMDATMAWTASGLFARAVVDCLTQGTAMKLGSDSFKVALYNSNTITPDKTVATDVLTYYNGAASQWVTGGECGNSGTYAAGGSAVTPVACTQTTNVVTFTSSGSPSWTSATITAYGDLVYDTTVSVGLCFNWFGGVQTVTAGTFTIVWSGSGIAYITC